MTSTPISVECPFCAQRAVDVASLRGDGGRGKQLGAWEREILRRSGPSDRRADASSRAGGLPLLREVFPQRVLDAKTWVADSPSQSVVRAAALRLEEAGLISLLGPTPGEATLWIEENVHRDWDVHDKVRRRLLLGNFSWRTLLGDEVVKEFQGVFGTPGSTARIRWRTRLDAAQAMADARCSEQHAERELGAWATALQNPRRPGAIARR